jgi:hypothetical protein
VDVDTGESRTFCNLATCLIASETGAPLDAMVDKKGVPLSANKGPENLATSNNYREVTPVEAQQLANQGITVIVAWRNEGGPGHLATVRPDNTYFAPYELMGGKSGPVINQVGAFTGIYRESAVFLPGSDVKYYAPK